MTDEPPLLRPTPQRPFSLTPASSGPTTPAQPSPQPSNNSSQLDFEKEDQRPSRNRSILNLTSSTLYGIYSPSANGAPSDGFATPSLNGTYPPTPRTSADDWKPPVIGAFQRPHLQRSGSQHVRKRDVLVPLVLRTILLFLCGVAYGEIVTHLSNNDKLNPVKIENVNRESWWYLTLWGVAGVLLGELLPWVDVLWEHPAASGGDLQAAIQEASHTRNISHSSDEEERPASGAESGLGADWNPAVRSIGAFVGIAFAIRKLPWQSTLQVSLTLALVNPVLWYLLDRSKPGFLLSSIVGLAGMAVLLGVNPSIVPPPPASQSPQASFSNVSYHGALSEGMISNESIGVGTWIASVLFCSSVCFGNIGRRLAWKRAGRWG